MAGLCVAGMLAKPVDQLAAGKPYTLHRWELPDGHPGRSVGSLDDMMALGADHLLQTRRPRSRN